MPHWEVAERGIERFISECVQHCSVGAFQVVRSVLRACIPR